jgi:hypothetical protein
VTPDCHFLHQLLYRGVNDGEINLFRQVHDFRKLLEEVIENISQTETVEHVIDGALAPGEFVLPYIRDVALSADRRYRQQEVMDIDQKLMDVILSSNRSAFEAEAVPAPAEEAREE